MEHPLIGDLSELTVDELSSKITNLYGKLNIAARNGNAHLCDQIRMALESYQNRYQAILDEQQKKANVNFDDKIKIQ
jgi:hypothetical protein